MIKVVYDSKTGLGKKFAEKVSDSVQSVSEAVDSLCILITRNVGRGKIPSTTKKFLKRYSQYVAGVVVNGDRRFGKYYCGAGPKIRDNYHVPIIRNIEKDGNDDDVREIVAFIQNIQSIQEPR
ncbi:MAG: class Ib ribonucleoside-diphosphate reductase assembly flavoprotein NrdI [Coriobacteriales bacterium]|nr:class Ib ribonucleoside-diphosphate reductase assembly flavoprotein NrdI [Coriobacteriales bacterium]